MIRNKSLSGVTVLLVTLLSLVVMGPGYASRAGNTAVVQATASSEQLLVGIRVGDLLDKGADPQHLPGANNENKDVASTETANIGEPVFSTASNDYYRSVSAIINNAYPFYKTGWTIEIANGGRLPARIDGIDMIWDDGSTLRDFVKLDEITIHQGEVTQTVNTWEDLEEALLQYNIPYGGMLTIDLNYYFEETGKEGKLMPENAYGKMIQVVRFSQDEPGEPGNPEGSGSPDEPDTPDKPDAPNEPFNPDEPDQPLTPPEEIVVPDEPGAASPPEATPPAQGPALPNTGGNIVPFVFAGVVLVTLGIMLRRRP